MAINLDNDSPAGFMPNVSFLAIVNPVNLDLYILILRSDRIIVDQRLRGHKF